MYRIFRFVFWFLLTIFSFELIYLLYFFSFFEKTSKDVFTYEFLVFFNITILFFSSFCILYKIKFYWTREKEIIESTAKNVFNFAKIGLLFFNDENEIIWINEYLKLRHKKLIFSSIWELFPRIINIYSQKKISVVEKLDDFYYNIFIFYDQKMMILLDNTDYRNLLTEYENNRLVVGILNVDNYEQHKNLALNYNEIKFNSLVNGVISDWCEKNNIFFHSFEKSKFLLLMTKEILDKLKNNNLIDDFLNEIKTKTKNFKFPITFSIGIGYGSNDPSDIFQFATNNLQNCIAKGGDQALITNIMNNYSYSVGANFEQRSYSKASKIMFFGRRLIKTLEQTEEIVICGHQFGDYDCVAAGIGMYYFCKNFISKKTILKVLIHINLLDENVKKKIQSIIPMKDLEAIYFLTPEKYKITKLNTTLIIVDTHIGKRIENPDLLSMNFTNSFVIDHHIFDQDKSVKIDDDNILIEPSVSSTSEIICELIFNLVKFLEKIPKYVFDLFLTGVLLDTDHFRKRTSQRTLEITSKLLENNAQIEVAENLLTDTIEVANIKNKILKNTFFYKNKFAIAIADEDLRISMSIIAQVAQQLSYLEEVKASFAISYNNNGDAAISCRSAKNFNVQAIAQELGGGGHFSAAAAQWKNKTIYQMQKYLLTILKEK
ncbi:DHH family phosphoesterase [symbiont of Argiope bruennichi]|uniref:DHH family phosphoesterase n=1 Tax=symbiont of Argiope bruennichi TaxID=2810479 RepID=UPI003DA68992